MPNEIEKIATLKQLHEDNYGKKTKVTKKGEWFNTRPSTSKLVGIGNALFGFSNLEICSTYEILILPADGKKVINQNATVATELTAAFETINCYQRDRRDSKTKFSSDVDVINITCEEMKDRLAQISFFENDDLIKELKLLVEFIDDLDRHPELFPPGIAGAKDDHMASVVSGVRMQCKIALTKLTLKDEKDPLPILIESITKKALALIPELFQYLFIVLRDKHYTNFPKIATVCQVRDTQASDRAKVLDNGLSELLIRVANTQAFKILFSSSNEQYVVDHNATRSARVLEARFSAIKQPCLYLKMNNFDELQGTIYQDKPCTFELNCDPAHIPAINHEIDLYSPATSGFAPIFCKDPNVIKTWLTLVGLLQELGKSVLHAEDAKAIATQIGDAGIRARYCTNLSIMATKLMHCCDDLGTKMKQLDTQCEHADNAAKQALTYKPLTPGLPVGLIEVSSSWQNNRSLTLHSAKAIIQRANQLKEETISLLQAAKEGLSKEKQEKLLAETNHFTSTTEYTAHAENIRPDKEIVNREDPDDLRSLKPAELSKIRNIVQRTFTTLLVRKLPELTKVKILSSYQISRINNFDLINMFGNEQYLNSGCFVDLSKELLPNRIAPSIDNLIEWITKIYLQQYQGRTARTKAFEDFFIDKINEEVLTRLYPTNIDHIFSLGYLLILLDRADALAKLEIVKKVLNDIKNTQEQALHKKQTLKVVCDTEQKLVDKTYLYLALLGLSLKPRMDFGDAIHSSNYHRMKVTLDLLVDPELEGENLGQQLETIIKNRFTQNKPELTLRGLTLTDRILSLFNTTPPPPVGKSPVLPTSSPGQVNSAPCLLTVTDDHEEEDEDEVEILKARLAQLKLIKKSRALKDNEVAEFSQLTLMLGKKSGSPSISNEPSQTSVKNVNVQASKSSSNPQTPTSELDEVQHAVVVQGQEAYNAASRLAEPPPSSGALPKQPIRRHQSDLSSERTDNASSSTLLPLFTGRGAERPMTASPGGSQNGYGQRGGITPTASSPAVFRPTNLAPLQAAASSSSSNLFRPLNGSNIRVMSHEQPLSPPPPPTTEAVPSNEYLAVASIYGKLLKKPS